MSYSNKQLSTFFEAQTSIVAWHSDNQPVGDGMSHQVAVSPTSQHNINDFVYHP